MAYRKRPYLIPLHLAVGSHSRCSIAVPPPVQPSGMARPGLARVEGCWCFRSLCDVRRQGTGLVGSCRCSEASVR